ncbi:helix-turn-helix domain-containing protein [Aquirufa rosea]|uniref:AraC family transcriptional regulator n=1 Tax=Aquirufa rosea TaxID=2509241 RepID=A0A4Q1BX10_9BACT|nr:helix-turn-helix domain-containing protein [Aquirufa rosea]RXK46533.1 AraC family transcriptional regulator [Aquirufa rosea]
MFDFVPYFSFLTSGIGLLFIAYLLIRFGAYPKVYWLIAIIFSLVFLEFYIYALTSKHIYRMLFLLRVPNIVRAFIPVCLYFYVNQMLSPGKPIKGWQWLHFVFPMVILIGVSPDLFLSSDEKRAILDGYYQKNNYLLIKPAGWIPPGIVQPVSILMGILYGCISWIQINATQKRLGPTFSFVNKQYLIWLKLVSGVLTCYFLLQFYQYATLLFGFSFDPPSQIIKCIIAISLFSFFMNSPNIQENMDGCIIPIEQNPTKIFPSLDLIIPNLVSEFREDSMAIQLDQKIKNSYCYLDASCDLAYMAKLVDLTPQKFSKWVKMCYGISFVEFLNRLKIHYFLAHFDHFDQYTLETYIYKSGFTNRSTFYAAFKKHVGVNPSFYLKEIKHTSLIM